jgi:hypothetical protein
MGRRERKLHAVPRAPETPGVLGEGPSMTDAILWLLWIPGSLILIALLVDSIIS